MTDTDEQISERDEIELLLPWYATGRLGAADRARVEDWLLHDGELARRLQLIREETAATVAVNEAITLPSTLTVERLMALAPAPHPGPLAVVERTWSRLQGWLQAPDARTVRFAAAVAGVLIVGQAVAIATLLPGADDAPYRTASGDTRPVTAGTFALVRFGDNVTTQGLAAALADLQMSIVDGPRPGGLFRVRIDARTLSPADRDARLAQLRARPGLVLLATPSP